MRRAGAVRRALAAAAVAGLGGVCATAQAPGPMPGDLAVSSSLERIVAADAGGVALALAPSSIGSHAEQLIYSVSFANTGEQLLDRIRITSPIPADVQYVQGSASGPGGEVLYSVDNGRTFGRPDELRVLGVQGVARQADPAEYTHVRFVLHAPLDAGATGIARFRAVPR